MVTNPRATTAQPTLKPIQALNRLLDIIAGYISAQAFLAACSLGLFEELSKGPIPAEDLSQRLEIHPVGCRRLLVALAKLGLVEREGQLYRNSELGQFCSSKSPVNLAGLAKGYGHPLYHMFEFLPDALREYSPRWQQALGTSKDVFGVLSEDPARLRQFALCMNAWSITEGQEIAQRFDFANHRCIMDVAGGAGGIAVQIGLQHPHLRGIIMDTAPVCEITKEYIQASGLVGRFTAMPADLFEGPYPHGADVMVLGHILHDWNDDNCCKILRHCSVALPAQGVLLVCEKVLEPDFSGSSFALMNDLALLVVFESEARERTEAEYRSLLSATGFEIAEVIRMDAPRDVIVARKM